MAKRERTLSNLFPQDCILNKPHIGESGRSFSIRKSSTEIIIALDLRRCSSWPKNRKIVDGLFVCLPANSSNFLVVLVELKGTDKEHAINQLNDTAATLCSRSQFPQQPHNETILESLTTHHTEGHSRIVVGLMIGRRSLPQKLRKKKMARVHNGLKIKDLTAKSLTVTVAELREWLD